VTLRDLVQQLRESGICVGPTGGITANPLGGTPAEVGTGVFHPPENPLTRRIPPFWGARGGKDFCGRGTRWNARLQACVSIKRR
jgi:hypothetical protein